MQIYPAVLTESLDLVQDQVNIVLEAAQEEVKAVQIDIADGFFTETLTISPLDLVEISFEELKCDLHLMVDEPLDFVYEAVSVKEYVPVRSVIAQVEHMSYQASFLEEIEKQGWLPGLALDIFTPFDAIDEESWQRLKVLQLMGNQAGTQGQSLHPTLITKLKEVATFAHKNGYEPEIIVDIGVTQDNVAELAKAGATGVAVGSAIWRAADPVQALKQLTQA